MSGNDGIGPYTGPPALEDDFTVGLSKVGPQPSVSALASGMALAVSLIAILLSSSAVQRQAAESQPAMIVASPVASSPENDQSDQVAAHQRTLVKQGLEIAALREELRQQRKAADDYRRVLEKNAETFGHGWRWLQQSGGFAPRRKFAWLDPAAGNSSISDSESGFFLVTCRGVTLQPDGTRVFLRIGNPLAVPVVGYRLALRWGPKLEGPANDFEAVARWFASLGSAEVSSKDRVLPPSGWHDVTVILPTSAYGEIRALLVEVAPATQIFNETPTEDASTTRAAAAFVPPSPGSSPSHAPQLRP